MTARSAVPSLRTIRTLTFSVTAGGAALCLALSGWVPPAAASSNPGSSGGAGASAPTGQPALQVQAQELAGRIEANGRMLDELDAEYNAAQIRLQSLDSQLAALRTGMARTTALAGQARHLLKEQALLAYLSGGAPLVYLPDRPGQDPSLTIAYAQIIAGGQKRAADSYRSDLRSMSRQAAALEQTEAQTRTVVASIGTDRARADATLADQHRALARVKGQMAVLVAQVESAQQNAQAPAASPTAQAASPATQAGSPSAQGPSPAQVVPAAGQVAPAVPAPADRAVAPAGSSPTVAVHRPPATSAQLIPATSAEPTTSYQPSTTRYVPPSTAAAPPPSAPTSGAGGTQAGTGGTAAVPAQAPGAGAVLAYARAQLGKPYQWAGAGPDSFDCSGLVMMAWDQAGIHFPHLAQDQYDMTARIPLSDALPGDLIFFGTPGNVYHVGIYIGNGQMIDAPETGQNVSVQSIYWGSLLGAGRVHT